MTQFFCHPSVLVIILSFIIYYLSTIRYQTFVNRFTTLYPIYSSSNFSTSQYQWTSILRENYKIIQKEFYEYEKISKSKLCYIDEWDCSFTKDRKWITIPLYHWGYWTDEIDKYFPKTINLIKENIVKYHFVRRAEFSVLKPGAFIPRHRGTYGGQLTYQLIIEVNNEINTINNYKKEFYLAVWNNTGRPANYWPPQYIPNIEPWIVTWKKNGSDLLFDDSTIHEAYNNLTKRRIVLIIDVERIDEDFKNSFIVKILHYMFVRKILPILNYYQKDILGLRDVVSKNDDVYGVYPNISTVRMPWFKIINNTNYADYIWNMNQNSIYYTNTVANYDKVVIITIVISMCVVVFFNTLFLK